MYQIDGFDHCLIGTPIYVFPCDMDFVKENLTEVMDGDSEE
jgi:hypothetical protein